MATSGSRRLWLILLLAVLVTLVYLPSAAVLFHHWCDFVNITFTHGWLILAVSVALVLQVRHELARVPAAPLPAAQLALLGASFAWLVCYRASIQDLHITIFPALFWLAVTAALRPARRAADAVPRGVLLFRPAVLVAARRSAAAPDGRGDACVPRDHRAPCVYRGRHRAHPERQLRGRGGLQWSAFHDRGPCGGRTARAVAARSPGAPARHSWPSWQRSRCWPTGCACTP